MFKKYKRIYKTGYYFSFLFQLYVYNISWYKIVKLNKNFDFVLEKYILKRIYTQNIYNCNNRDSCFINYVHIWFMYIKYYNFVLWDMVRKK